MVGFNNILTNLRARPTDIPRATRNVSQFMWHFGEELTGYCRSYTQLQMRRRSYIHRALTSAHRRWPAPTLAHPAPYIHPAWATFKPPMLPVFSDTPILPTPLHPPFPVPDSFGDPLPSAKIRDTIRTQVLS